MLEVVLETDAQIIFITPYYVPGEERVDIVRKLVDKGVEVIIVTNSLASNNHIPVHSAYTRYRKEVIRAGAKLYEARANAAHEAQGSSEGPDALTMHTKAIVVDRRYLFVGSLNLDPRSIDINAEMGLLIDSPEMVRAATFDAERNLETLTYRVTLNEEGNLEWRSTIDGQEVVETKEPLSSRWRRFQAWLYKLAPESQL
jgi:putative cardiolipin synthase